MRLNMGQVRVANVVVGTMSRDCETVGVVGNLIGGRKHWEGTTSYGLISTRSAPIVDDKGMPQPPSILELHPRAKFPLKIALSLWIGLSR
jgi:hypothetical protein